MQSENQIIASDIFFDCHNFINNYKEIHNALYTLRQYFGTNSDKPKEYDVILAIGVVTSPFCYNLNREFYTDNSCIKQFINERSKLNDIALNMFKDNITTCEKVEEMRRQMYVIEKLVFELINQHLVIKKK